MPTERDTFLLQNRPNVKNAVLTKGMSEDETFQNLTLRPVIKGIHEILIVLMKNYISKHSKDFSNYTNEKKVAFIESAMMKNVALRNTIFGTVTGNFTMDEYNHYIGQVNSINKRISGIVKQRYLDSLVEIG